MSNLIVKFKKLHPNAVLPSYAKLGDAGLDLTAVSVEYEGGLFVYNTGLAIELPEGYVGLLFQRSSICKYNLSMTNAVGVIDSGYRGEILFKFRPTDDYPIVYKVGDRIGQLVVMPFPKVQIELTEELSSTERGTGGYGSSGQ